MNLSEKPKAVKWPATHYVFVEKVGPFMETAKPAWDRLHELVPEIAKYNQIDAYLALYKFKPKNTYRAGVALESKPVKLPKGLTYEVFEGGAYSKFTLKGPYSDLPEACGHIYDKYVPSNKVKLRNDWCIENYTNDPKITAEKDLITEILIPTA